VAVQETTKGQRTAGRILDVAEALFAQNGYAATSLRDIAEQAGLQQPGLYKHFAGKEELYRRVYDRALQPMTDLMDSMLAGHEVGFGELAERMTDLLALHPNIASLLVRATISSDGEEDLVALEWLGRLVKYGRQLNAMAGLPSRAELQAVQVVAFYNMLFGFFWASPLIENLSGKPATDPAVMDLQKSLLRSFIGYLEQASRAEALS